MTKFNFTNLEFEVITLKASLELIDKMVNYEMMSFSLSDPDSEVRLKSISHMAYFNILLNEFLSGSELLYGKKNYLERLKDICESPLLQESQHIHDLKNHVVQFSEWLSKTVTIPNSCFPSINLEINLNINRKDFIMICGNIMKHNFIRLTGQVEILEGIMKKNKVDITPEQSLLALIDFEEQFHDDIFEYHSSTIAEFLNNIRWGIYQYANEERNRVVTCSYDPGIKCNRYSYEYPLEINSTLGKYYYWELMNDVKSEPCVPQFQVTKYLKMRY